MPKITEAKRESRRQQILDAALTCFSRDGFHATTTADIVRESGVSQGTLYLYFATKDDIVVALADDRHQGEAFLNALAQSEHDPVHGLFLLIELYGKSLDDPRRVETAPGRHPGLGRGAAQSAHPRERHRRHCDGARGDRAPRSSAASAPARCAPTSTPTPPPAS